MSLKHMPQHHALTRCHPSTPPSSTCLAVTALTNLALNKQHVNLTLPAIEALVNIAAAKASLLPNNITLLPEVTAILSTTKLPSVDLSAITSMLRKPNIDLSGLTVSGSCSCIAAECSMLWTSAPSCVVAIVAPAIV